jgi:DNA-binding response OmpR family regulator
MVDGQLQARLREKVDIRAMLFGKKKRRITRLLLVEDEPLVAFDNERFLVDEEFEIVATVDRVFDAVALIRGDDVIDLVLVDISLADGSGLDVAHAAYECGIAAMFVTGDCPAGGEAVAMGCLSKPYAQRDLLAAINAVEAVLDGRKPKRLPGGFRLFARPEAA